jgi:hypothetical protein
MDGPDLDPEEGEPLVEDREVLHVARQAVERLDDDDLEAALPRGVEQVEEAVAPEDGGTGPGRSLCRSVEYRA